jgi:hypothetical protein
MRQIQFVRHNRIANKILLIDGAPRSGKSLLGQIISSFERVEIERMEPFIESLPVLYSFNKLSKDAAVTLLRGEVDMKLYDSMISRNINFRFSDRTAVFNGVNTIEYFKRLFKNDGNNVLHRIKKERPIFQMQTHDILQKSDLFFDAFGDSLRIVEMVRHPLDLITSMYLKGYGSDIGINPLTWELSIKTKEHNVPYYAFGWVEEYIKSTPMDRVIKIVQHLTNQAKEKYNSFSPSKKTNIFFVVFEEFVTKPDKYINRLAKFVGTSKTKRTNKTIKKQKIPRVIDSNKQKVKYYTIKEKASSECLSILHDLVNEYEHNYLNT